MSRGFANITALFGNHCHSQNTFLAAAVPLSEDWDGSFAGNTPVLHEHTGDTDDVGSHQS